MLLSSSTAINVIEDLTPAKQGKTFAGWREIYYDYAEWINLTFKTEVKFHKI
jgi:hypothetical protein